MPKLYISQKEVSDDNSIRIKIQQNYCQKSSISSSVSNIENEVKRNSSSFCSKANITSLDIIPQLENYSQEEAHKNISRPPLEVLHQPRSSDLLRWLEKPNPQMFQNEDNQHFEHRFGWITGVYVPTFMNLLGAVVYLRMGWVTGQAGIILSILQILIGFVILSVTVLSMTAICTNGQVGSGGFYFMISRSLGPETGTMFGVMYFLTNAIMVAFNIVGICEEVAHILQIHDLGIIEYPTGFNDQRLVGAVCLILVAIIPFISLDFEAKTQWLLFAIVILSLVDYFVGTFIPPNNSQKVRGFVGWDISVFTENLLPEWSDENFFTVFAVYVSSIAGDFTGATMSSTLKDASIAIPKGTILAVATSSSVYILLIVFLGSTVVRHASGNDDDLKLNNFTCHQKCGDYGLINDYNTISLSSALTHTGLKVEPLITAGLFAQTISSAMCAYIAAPQIFQALASDGVLPYIGFFAKGYGKMNEPRRGYILTFFIAIGFIAISDFNLIAAVISNCYLASWCLLNISCFHADYVCAPSFRPSFKWFNKWISLLFGIICFGLMFCFDWISALALLSLMTIIWLYIYYHKPDVNWGPTTNSQFFKTALSITNKLNLTSDHVKNYRPSILLLAGKPTDSMDLIYLANKLTKNVGLLIVADIRRCYLSYKYRTESVENWNNLLNKDNIKCFYTMIEAKSYSEGAYMLIQCSGLGKLKPNILMMGFKEKWQTCDTQQLVDYFNIIHFALQMHQSLVIYRSNEKQSHIQSINNGFDLNQYISNVSQCRESSSNAECDGHVFQPSVVASEPLPPSDQTFSNSKNLNKKPYIDIWWLYDDGGLTVLLAYILSERNQWKKCKLRVFTIADKANKANALQQNLSNLLIKFRIPYSDVTVFSNLGDPHVQSIEKFNKITNKWSIDRNDQIFKDKPQLKILQTDFDRFNKKTMKYIRLRELLLQHSSNTSLIVMTSPIPQKNICPAPLYMSWLELLSSEMPPFLFIRGNQTHVLTFYNQ